MGRRMQFITNSEDFVNIAELCWRPTELKQKGDKLSVLRIRIALQHCSGSTGL